MNRATLRATRFRAYGIEPLRVSTKGFNLAQGAILLACLALPACGDHRGWEEAPASCVRISTGDKLTGSALLFDREIREYHMRDQNGILGKINAENSSSYRCKREGSANQAQGRG